MKVRTIGSNLWTHKVTTEHLPTGVCSYSVFMEMRAPVEPATSETIGLLSMKPFRRWRHHVAHYRWCLASKGDNCRWDRVSRSPCSEATKAFDLSSALFKIPATREGGCSYKARGLALSVCTVKLPPLTILSSSCFLGVEVCVLFAQAPSIGKKASFWNSFYTQRKYRRENVCGPYNMLICWGEGKYRTDTVSGPNN